MMGEYILLDGQPNKIGTTEDLYYCRYTDLVGWIDAGRAARMPANEEPADYLAGAYRFRFPFPDEDGTEAGRLRAYGAEYNRGVLIPYPPELLTEDITHYNAYAGFFPHLRGHVADYPIRVIWSVTCPLGAAARAAMIAPTFETLAPPDETGSRWYEKRGPWVGLTQQRPFDGMLWAVFKCPWCGARWRVEREEAARIAAYAQATAPELDLSEIMRRMLAGYDGLPGRPVSLAESGGA